MTPSTANGTSGRHVRSDRPGTDVRGKRALTPAIERWPHDVADRSSPDPGGASHQQETEETIVFQNLTLTIGIVIAGSAVAAAMSGISGLAPQADRPAPPPPPEPRHHQEEPRPEPRSPSGGHLDIGMDDGGTWFEMTGRDASGTTGGAGISMTDDGFHLELRQDDAAGSGSAGAAMTDEGVQLWFDVDQSQ